MIHREKVHCGPRDVKEFEINHDTVYKRYNIQTITDSEGHEGREYDEDEYSLLEYLKLKGG